MASPSRLSMKNVAERRAVTRAVIEPILTAKRDEKLAGDYKRMAPDPNGFVHTLLLPNTASFRLSSGGSLVFPNSTNMQNLAKKVAKYDKLYRIRDIVRADPGMTLVCVDYKGAEALLVGAYSQDWGYVDKLLAGADTHRELASLFFDKAQADVSEVERAIAKTLTYASFYMASVPTLTIHMNKDAHRTGVTLTQREVEQYRGIILQEHPLEAWWERTKRELARTGGILRNALGYRRIFHAPDEHKRCKDGLSFYPQSTVACLMNEAWSEIADRVVLIGNRELRHQIHDEIMMQARPDEVPDLVRTVRPLLERTFTVHERSIYIPTEWKVGEVWGTMEAYHE